VREDVLERVNKAVEMTAHNDQAVLNVCFPYTSREEITHSIRDTVREFSTPPDREEERRKRPFSETHIQRNIRSRQLSSVAEEERPKDMLASSTEAFGVAAAAASDADSTDTSEQDLDASSLLQPASSQTSHSTSPVLKPSATNARSSQQQHFPDPEMLTEDHLTKNTYTSDAPPLDLLVRTSGVARLSDFMLWQCHENTEIRFLDILWPEFDLWQFLPVLVEWQWRQRKLGEEGRLGSAPVLKVQ